ncbi:MFS general substrate transporter, partial [Martensiomyces pterosporus]
LDTILDYYSHTEYKPSPEQIERDRWVFFGLFRCRPWMSLPAGVLIQFCYGSVYAWSIFNGPINTAMTSDPEKGQAEITFYIALGVLGITGALFGPWIESSHPQKSGAIGLAVFFSGHLTTALAIYARMMSLLYFGYGFVAGVGLGIGYVSTIDAMSKWWPKARGTAAGCAVMGFGGGSLAFSAINKWLVDHASLPSAFVVLGAINLAVMGVCIQFIRPPPPGHNVDGVPMVENSAKSIQTTRMMKHLTEGSELTHTESTQQRPRYLHILGTDSLIVHISLAEALRSRDFWLLYVSFLANIVFCLVVLSNLPSMINHLFGSESRTHQNPPLPAYLAVSIEGGFNMAGRIAVGFVSDVVGRKATFLMLLLTQAAVLVCIPFSIQAGSCWAFLGLVWTATVCYGGGFGMVPAFLSDMFGSNNTSSCHGIFLTAWSIASIFGGMLFTGINNRFLNSGARPYDTKMYTVNFMWMLALVVAGLLCCLFVRSSIKDRLFPALPDQVLRMRVFGRVLRVLWRLHIEVLSKAQEQAAWEEYL